VIERELLADWLVRLCAVDTTTGRESAALPCLRDILMQLGATIHEQPVGDGRSNVLATWAEPQILFSTHVDTVPPFIAPTRHEDTIRGRGSCDAKGQAVAQLGAVRRLLATGDDNVAWLGVVGEETDSDGARAALALAPRLGACRAVINGEPTGLAIASGQRGVLHLRLVCRGVAAHTSQPQRGRNALWMLHDWLAALRRLPARRDDELGDESWSLSRMRGGAAINVVPDHAEAELLARTVRESTFLQEVRAAAPAEAEIEVLLREPPAVFPAVEGFARRPMPYGSDAVTLRELVPDGLVVLAGPGDIERAHTDDEHLTVDELIDGVALHERLARRLLGAAP